MNKLMLSVGGAAILASGAFAGSAMAQSGSSVAEVARHECRQELRQDRADFQRDYGGVGAAALRRCVREERREARRACRQERREDAAEFRAEYGPGAAAFRRCLIDEIR
jgi:hypothetical protein